MKKIISMLLMLVLAVSVVVSLSSCQVIDMVKEMIGIDTPDPDNGGNGEGEGDVPSGGSDLDQNFEFDENYSNSGSGIELPIIPAPTDNLPTEEGNE